MSVSARPQDANPYTALEWASELGLPPSLPLTLEDVAARAALVDSIDPLIANVADGLQGQGQSEKSALLERLASLTKEVILDVSDDQIRVNISLRLWSGCSGPNSPEDRNLLFRRVIDPRARTDPIYRAGVDAAPAFKDRRAQPWSFEGVPADSPIRV